MNRPADETIYLAKAKESLDGAESEFANGRYNSCANRCYYACFQAAIAALLHAGIRPVGTAEWGHAFVQREFVGQLINRCKLYPGSLRDVLARTSLVREKADYDSEHISEVQAARVLRRAREFVRAVELRERRRS